MYLFLILFGILVSPQYSDSIAEHQNSWQDEYQTALSAIRDKNFKLAVLILNDLSKKTETRIGSEGILYHLGISYYGLKKFTESQKSFERVLSTDSSSVFFARSMYWRGEIFRESKKYNEALKDLTEFASKFPKDEYSMKAYGSIAEI